MQNSHEFYKEAIKLLNENAIRFLIGGAWALKIQTEISRDTKDLDVFCTYSDYPLLLNLFANRGYITELTDARWLAKVYKGEHFIDIIFNSRNILTPVDESWFKHSILGELWEQPVNYVSAEDLFCSKIYVMNRDRYDGADLNHIILRKGQELDWHKILETLESHWQLLFSHILNFQFVYPSERNKIPEWLFNTLLERAKNLYKTPLSIARICRGPLLTTSEYLIDINEWGYIQ